MSRLIEQALFSKRLCGVYTFYIVLGVIIPQHRIGLRTQYLDYQDKISRWDVTQSFENTRKCAGRDLALCKSCLEALLLDSGAPNLIGPAFLVVFDQAYPGTTNLKEGWGGGKNCLASPMHPLSRGSIPSGPSNHSRLETYSWVP